MNAGYVRLSKDDDKRNYVSIENQKLIIRQYAASQNLAIDCWYEDDGVSGYKFDRPGFCRLMEDLDKEIDAVFVKDFSRLGRHNAKVLLLLDEFQERGKRLVVIDDNYDSFAPDDDVIGIKTWYNEKYVKDTSRKIRRVLEARQKEGTLLTHVPFGYQRNDEKKESIEIVPEEAAQVKQIYELYTQGLGYRKIAAHLTENLVPTPSAIRHQHALSQGKPDRRPAASQWSESMVKNILGNDFYIGTYRLHKRARATVHGKDKRVPKEEQYIFENHHPAVIDKKMFALVQEMKAKRIKTNYRGSRGQWMGNKISHLFESCLFCKDCGHRLTPIIRKTSGGERKYYICSTYNTKGKQYCSKAHLIEENDLTADVVNYLCLCRNSLREKISAYDWKSFEAKQQSMEEKETKIIEMIDVQKEQLKSLLAQKIKDLASNPAHKNLIAESYHTLQEEIFSHIHSLEIQLQELKKTSLKTADAEKKTPLEVLDEIIENGTLNQNDIHIFIEKIEVDENGQTDITLTYRLSPFIKNSPSKELNRQENEILFTAMKLICENPRSFTSAKYLSENLTKAGYPKSRKSVFPYLCLMENTGILASTENNRKPYLIKKTREEIAELIADYQKNNAVSPIHRRHSNHA